ncbi:hypothetical protein Tco_0548273 [Tanacetum coccineum]
MMVQPTQDDGVDSGIPTDSLQTPITTQPSSSKSQKKQSKRKQRKDTAVTQEETQQDDSVPTPSNDPPLCGKGCSSKGNCCFKEEGLKVGKEQEVKNYKITKIKESSAASTTIEEITLARTLIQIKVAKPKVVTTAATTPTTTRPKARGVIVQEPNQVALDEDLARNLQAQLEVKLYKNFELAQKLQTEEQGEITIEERSRLFVELINKRKKQFAMLRDEEKEESHQLNTAGEKVYAAELQLLEDLLLLRG